MCGDVLSEARGAADDGLRLGNKTGEVTHREIGLGVRRRCDGPRRYRCTGDGGDTAPQTRPQLARRRDGRRTPVVRLSGLLVDRFIAG